MQPLVDQDTLRTFHFQHRFTDKLSLVDEYSVLVELRNVANTIPYLYDTCSDTLLF